MNYSNSKFAVNIDFYDKSVDDCLTHMVQHALAGKTTILMTPNIDHLVRMHQDKHIAKLYSDADMCINDSRIFSIIIKRFFSTSLATITGSDVTQAFFEQGYGNKLNLGIVGCDSKQIKLLCDKYGLAFPALHVNPSYGFIHKESEVQEIVSALSSTPLDIIFLAVGSPQQEILAHRLKGKIAKGSILCVGASLDYLTGKEKRAPDIVQALSLEWLYRFLQSPIKRFNRYFVSCPKIFRLLRSGRFTS
ncbi:WecB/TagA/CpsF family glycosyltransferase [Alteromonas sp. 5E99-2]|uniref:WecB/TagA/CpsF family glycosyltransferase n=1 Tax=Alteromonas sp. 5E99-2 TaxID=2817683 RepID=UPI001A986189|nr:WecB/TagA/CpsF family glycosyltransferase [Alteromonas sp. 5E99-2]MBO1254238.1 WecB/TagA/CpsF family glycosyltransferase [Alteromonas sp. 5E99-2]